MADASARGRWVWYDLMTSDQKKSEAFYTKVAGWGTMPWDGPMPYTMWTVDGTPIGGSMALPPGAGAPPHWLGYVAVPDVDASVKQAVSLGATKMHGPEDIPKVGRYAILSDPQGAVFSLFTSQNESGPEGPPKSGEFSWHELMTTDYVAAFQFYQTLFGWEKTAEHDMGEIGVYLIFSRNGLEIGGMFNKTAEMRMPPNWVQYIMVDSCARVVDVIKQNGGTVMNGPMEVPGGDWIAQCMDPVGAMFAIHSKGK